MSPALLLALALTPAQPADPPKDKKDEKGLPVAALKARLVGTAVTSGRIVGFAVNPNDRSHYFVAVASGGVWKTTNAGTTWTPVFDGEGSYSIGCVVMDPKNPSVLWVGTGENNSRRVSCDDGVYKSTDGGKTWQNVGPQDKRAHRQDSDRPRDSDTVFVAAQGPLWKEGGDRGLFKTTDGGKTVEQGAQYRRTHRRHRCGTRSAEPGHLIAASWQRRRHVWTIINGGPGPRFIARPTAARRGRKSRAACRPAISAASAWRWRVRPDVVYASSKRPTTGGIHRSTDRGITWESAIFAAQAYYSHLVVDPVNKDASSAMNVFIPGLGRRRQDAREPGRAAEARR